MKKIRLGLLSRILIAIVLGVLFGLFFPQWAVRIFATINDLFSNFLGFCIPLIIFGLVAPAIADLGKSAGKLLLITVALAYAFTLFSGFFTYFSCMLTYSGLLKNVSIVAISNPEDAMQQAYFTIEMLPIMGVMTALLLAFVLGLGIAYAGGETLKRVLFDFKGVIEKIISYAVVPLLPLYIFGIFLNISYSGAILSIAKIFLGVVILIVVLHILILLIQFGIAGAVSKSNPLRLLKTMLPAYLTALGTQSSAATIPVTMRQVKLMGVNNDIAGFTVPLCANIHLSGSTMKIVACAMAVMMLKGMDVGLGLMTGFILMLGIIMVAAPGVPGGAIMAALGILQSMLGFGDVESGLMIAIYIALDGFGTACNVTGDGAISVIVNRISGYALKPESK
jgi:Na+/H+-dicarboxylate symporter